MNSIRPSLIYSTMVWLVAATLNGLWFEAFNDYNSTLLKFFENTATIAFFGLLISCPVYLLFILLVWLVMDLNLKRLLIKVICAFSLGFSMWIYSRLFSFKQEESSILLGIVLSSVLATLLIPLNLKWIKYNPSTTNKEQTTIN